MKAVSRGKVVAALCLFASILQSYAAKAQFSNEWINFTQTYYKIPVAKNGIYNLTYTDLQTAGIPLGAVDPRRINLFHRGIEQAIYVQGQADASFDPSDFIEFYGQRNDGTLDGDLYKPATLQPHPYYNLFNDTTAYFLTWNPLPVQGKRMNSFIETNGSGLAKESFHNEERMEVYAVEYAGGLTFGGEIQNTAFDQGEGWTGPLICSGTSGCTGQQDFIIDNLMRGVVSGSLPQLELLVLGRDALSHQAEIYAGANGGSLRLLTTTSFINFETVKQSLPLDWSDIGADGKMTVRVRLSAAGTQDRISVSYIKVTFSQDYNANAATEKIFNLQPNGLNKSYLEITNTLPGTRIWDVTDPDNVSIIGTSSFAGGIGAMVPGTLEGRKLYTSNTKRTVAIQKVSFRAIIPSLHNFIIISHRSLMKSALGYGDAVQSYAAYRASVVGGSYDTLTVSIDQLFNQFNYGETSPRAIYQFMRFLVNGGNPKFLFLIGKGIEVSQGFYRKTSFAPDDFRDLVPSAGMPGADMAFTAGLKGTSYEPAVPTGRLTASTPVQVAAYLNKVKESEALEFNALWRKDLLHLSGGINAGEPLLFRQYVDGFKAIAEGFFLGGKTETISKLTLNVDKIIVKDQVNNGLDLITFFGHSGPGTIDIDIGYVSDPTLGYNNAGKYPGFLINGCNAGRFFDNRVTFGEDWMLTPNKGAKAFIAHSSFGFTNALKLYSDIFYSIAFGDSTYLRKGIGEVQKETARRYLIQSGVSLSAITQVQQMMLLGDPAVPLFGASKPDYEINNGSLSIVPLDGNPVTAQSDSFAIEIRVRNFGRALPGPMPVRVVRTLNDNSTIAYDSLFSPVLYSEVLRFVIRKGRSNAEFGNTNFAVFIDPDRTVPELNESNNTASIQYFIPLNGTKNLFPKPFAIVNSTSVELVFQNTDLTGTSRDYKIEIDTAATFDSPFLIRKTVSGKVIAKAPLTLLPGDSLAYFWRTKFDKRLTESESDKWTSSSFVYIKGSQEGWAQVQFPQFAEDKTAGLVMDPEIRRLRFLETVSTVAVKTFGAASPFPYSSVSLKISGEEYNVATQEQHCRNNTLNLVAFDKSSTAPYAGIPFKSFFDPRACGRAPQMINSFLVTELETGNGDDLAQYVSQIMAGDSVVAFSIGDAGYSSWSAGVKLRLAELGVATNQLDGVLAGEPFVIFGKKGAASGSAKIFRPSQSPADVQEVLVNKTITGRYSQGSLASVIIGPARQWSQFVSQLTEATPSDIFGVNITGIGLTGQETVLKTQLKGTQSLSDINATSFPYLKLVMQTRDDVNLTPVQLRKWLVTYTPMAEGMLTYGGLREPETVQEGQDWKAGFGFVNISPHKFTDSLAVQVDILSAEQRSAERQIFKIQAPDPNDTTKFLITVKTKGKAGMNDATVFVNPRVQPEPYYDNNILTLYNHLNVVADRTAPVLEVTIDGRRIANGDFVSAAPLILSKMIDRNPFLLKTDTVGVNLYLQYPCPLDNCPYKRINFSQKDVSWKPATATSDFQVMFYPKALPAGAYGLKVEAVDASGNASGDVPYEVAFVVTEDQAFTLQSVYPNPSSSAFYFKILLTGPAIPNDFQLNVYSPTGGMIRSFGNEVLSQLHIGENEISLNATDANGNPLSPGIYLFRIITSMSGHQFTKSGRLMVVR